MLSPSSDFIAVIGWIASIATICQIMYGSGGQLLKLGRCNVLEVTGIHCGNFVIGAFSHALWATWGMGMDRAVVVIPNVLGSVLSALIAYRVLSIRRSVEVGSVPTATAA